VKLKSRTPWGQGLERFRLQLGLSCGSAARICKVSRRTYSRYEEGGSPEICADCFKKLGRWSRTQNDIMQRARDGLDAPPVQEDGPFGEPLPPQLELDAIKARLWDNITPGQSLHPFNSAQVTRVAACLADVILYLEGGADDEN
jgi:hypothetical protein